MSDNTPKAPAPTLVESGAPRTLLRTRPLPARRRPRARWVASAAILLLIVAGLVTWYRATRPPSLAVDQLAAAVSGWPGVTYRGRVSDGVFDPADVVATVNRAGTVRGTISRDGGHAEFAVIGADRFIKGDRAWWQASDRRMRDRFTGVWLRDPAGQLGAVPSLLATPDRLVDTLRRSAPWRADRPDAVGGTPAEAYTSASGDRVVVVSGEPAPRLFAVEPPAGHDVTARLEVATADARALAPVDATATEVAGASNYWDLMAARPEISLDLSFPSKTCLTPTCSMVVHVTNTGTLPETFRLEAWLNGALVQTFPVVSAPGSTLDFTANALNPAHGSETATLLWHVRTATPLSDD